MNRALPITDIAALDGRSVSAWPLLRPAVQPSELACCCPARPALPGHCPGGDVSARAGRGPAVRPPLPAVTGDASPHGHPDI
jgi:hypothetical protein